MAAQGRTSRVELSEATGLSSGTVTRISQQLIAEGLLQELPRESQGHTGAPRVPLEISAHRHLTLGIHVGQRRLNVGIVDLRGRVIDRCEVPYDTTDVHDTLSQAHAAYTRMTAGKATPPPVMGTAFSVGGLVEAEAGTVVENRGLGWEGVPLQQLAEPLFPHPIAVDSTYRGLARSQVLFRHAPSTKDFALLFIGNVIGAAVVIDGRIHPGNRYRAGNVAHLPVSINGEPCPHYGHTNCLLAIAGDQAVIRRASSRGILPPDASDQQLMDLIATSTDHRTEALFLPRAQAIGQAIATLTDVLDPDQVLLADPIMGAHRTYSTTLRDAANERRDPGADHTRLIGVSPDGVVGAATSVLNAFYDDPLHPW